LGFRRPPALLRLTWPAGRARRSRPPHQIV